MRRENERLLQDHIDEFMEDAKKHIDESSVIFLHAPGMNRNVFMSEGRPLYNHAHKVKSI